MTHGIYEFALTLPITQSDRRTAQEFAHHQPTAAKADQIRLNTLAVLVMQNYLQLMEIATNVTAGDSWNAVMRVCLDVADLELPEVGRLECRPILPDRDRCAVPAETWEDRVGYVVVQIDEAAAEAQILGFVPTVTEEEVLLSELRSPEDLLDHLGELRRVPAMTPPTSVVAASSTTAERTLTNLGNWLQSTLQSGQQAIEAGWQTVEQALNPPELGFAPAFRRGREVRGEERGRRAKRIFLGENVVALVVDVRSNTDSQREIRLQLHPVDAQTRLPVGLQIAVLDLHHEVVIAAETTGNEDFLELQIDGASGEEFSVQLRFNAFQDTQAFVI